MVIVDGNGLGSGLVDQLLLDSYDELTGEYLQTYNDAMTQANVGLITLLGGE